MGIGEICQIGAKGPGPPVLADVILPLAACCKRNMCFDTGLFSFPK